jgi:hypothetical protein
VGADSVVDAPAGKVVVHHERDLADGTLARGEQGGDLGHMVQVEQQAQAGEAPAQDHQLRVHSTH